MGTIAKNSYNERPWLDNYESGVPYQISFEKKLLPDFLERSAKLFPDVNALNFEGELPIKSSILWSKDSAHTSIPYEGISGQT